MYDGLAGEQAARQYANSEAVAYFSRALQLAPDDEAVTRFGLLLKREEVFDRQGNRKAQTQDLSLLASLAEFLDNTQGRLEVGLRQANAARLTGDYAGALRQIEKIEALAETARDDQRRARCYVLRSPILAQQDDYKAAQSWLMQAVQVAEQAQDVPLMALGIYDLATATYLQGQFELARQHVVQARVLYTQISDRRGEANCLRLLGVIEKNQTQRFDVARGYYEQALAICQQIGWLHGESYLLASIGNTLFDLGDYPSARRYHQQALAIAREVGDREGESVCLDTLGLVAALLGGDQLSPRELPAGARHSTRDRLLPWRGICLNPHGLRISRTARPRMECSEQPARCGGGVPAGTGDPPADQPGQRGVDR